MKATSFAAKLIWYHLPMANTSHLPQYGRYRSGNGSSWRNHPPGEKNALGPEMDSLLVIHPVSRLYLLWYLFDSLLHNQIDSMLRMNYTSSANQHNDKKIYIGVLVILYSWCVWKSGPRADHDIRIWIEIQCIVKWPFWLWTQTWFGGWNWRIEEIWYAYDK